MSCALVNPARGILINGVIDNEGTEVYWHGTSIVARVGEDGVPVLEKAFCPM